jgi:hypothetical protein
LKAKSPLSQASRDYSVKNVQNEVLVGLTQLLASSPATRLNITDDDKPRGKEPGLRLQLRNFLTDQKNRRKAFLILWVILVTLMLAFTLIVLGASIYLFHAYHVGVLIVVSVWALFFGSFVLFYLPPKLVTTFLGGLVGLSVSEVPSGAGLLSKLNSFVQSVVEQLIIIVGGKENIDKSFASICVWVFVAITMVMCLPAFFGTDESK